VGWLMCGLELHFGPPKEIAVVGPPEDPDTVALRRAALARFEPGAVYAFSTGADDPAAAEVPLLVGKGLVEGRPAAYVCEAFACRAPVTDPEALAAELAAEPIRAL
jgi:uncharacterized protein YyaL (SSP411 family)